MFLKNPRDLVSWCFVTGKAPLDTLYCLDTGQRTWIAYDHTQVQGIAPAACFLAGMIAVGDVLYHFGGFLVNPPCKGKS
jgi:hypothetical protein